jgi:hypothetical protein
VVLRSWFSPKKLGSSRQRKSSVYRSKTKITGAQLETGSKDNRKRTGQKLMVLGTSAPN